MRRIIPAAALLVSLVSCAQTRKESVQTIGTGAPVTPAVGMIATVWAVTDEATANRIGYVEETRYDNGAIIYMVRGPDRRTGQGYILPNNVAYRYTWINGERSSEHEMLGAATFASGARQILRYERPVALLRLSDEDLTAEVRARNAPAEAAAETGTGGESPADEDSGEFEE